LKNKITSEKVTTVVDKGQSGMTTKMWRFWVSNVFISDPNVQSGDSLDVDHLECHKDPQATKALNDKGISLNLFPKGAAPTLSMCDNSLFHDFKSDFKKIWTGVGDKKKLQKMFGKNFQKLEFWDTGGNVDTSNAKKEVKLSVDQVIPLRSHKWIK